MDKFLRRKNLERYRALLDICTDEALRAQLLILIAEEEAKEPAPKRGSP